MIKKILGATVIILITSYIVSMLIGIIMDNDGDKAIENIRQKYGQTIFDETYTGTTCETDGIGITRVPFGVIIQRCTSKWYAAFGGTFVFKLSKIKEAPQPTTTPLEWVTYNNSKGLTFAYPPDWIVEPINYQTPAQEGSGHPAEEVGLVLHPANDPWNGGITKEDIITVGGRQESCDNPNVTYTRCATGQYLPLWTRSHNQTIIEVFDRIATTYK